MPGLALEVAAQHIESLLVAEALKQVGAGLLLGAGLGGALLALLHHCGAIVRMQ
jgi:hypothetical protein